MENEKAENWCKKNCGIWKENCNIACNGKQAYIDGFIDGRNEKQMWHNLKENSKDLPESDYPVIIKLFKNNTEYFAIAYYIDTLQEFVMDYNKKSIQKEEVIKWRKFDK